MTEILKIPKIKLNVESKPIKLKTQKPLKTAKITEQVYNEKRLKMDNRFIDTLMENKKDFDQMVRLITEKYFEDRKELDSKFEPLDRDIKKQPSILVDS